MTAHDAIRVGSCRRDTERSPLVACTRGVGFAGGAVLLVSRQSRSEKFQFRLTLSQSMSYTRINSIRDVAIPKATLCSGGPRVTTGKIVEDMAKPLGGYSHVKVVDGLAFVCGLSARRPDDSIDGVDFVGPRKTLVMDITAQTRGCIENVATTLADVGLGLDDIVSVTTYLTDMNDFAAYNAAYAEFFGEGGPVRTTVGVSQLPHPHLLIEMTVIAKKANE